MAKNLYEVIATRDKEMVKFLDENIELSRLFKKMIGLIAGIAHDWRVSATDMRYDVKAMTTLRDGDTLVIRLMKKHEQV